MVFYFRDEGVNIRIVIDGDQEKSITVITGFFRGKDQDEAWCAIAYKRSY